MKKQIALLATLIAASGFTAFGQDWVTFGTETTHIVYDEFTTPGVGVYAGFGAVNVSFLWNASTTLTGSAADLLSAVPGTGGASDPNGYGQKNATPLDQVATNGVTSVSSYNPQTEIANMLSAGWVLGNNYNSGAGSAATGFVSTPTGQIGTSTQLGGIPEYNNLDPFEFSQSTAVASGADLEMIYVAWVGPSLASATALGWSNPFIATAGTSSTDSNAGINQAGSGILNQFGVAGVGAVPEPTTLALAGLGGLSMLFLRRRKA